MSPRTLPGLLARRALATPSAPAHCIKTGGAWTTVSWDEFKRRTDAVAAALAAHGIGPGDRVGILGPTCIEWEYLQMGAVRLGAVAVGIDPHYGDDTLEALLRALGLAALGVEDAAMLARVPGDVIGSLKLLAAFEAPVAAPVPVIALAEAAQSRHAPLEREGPAPGDDAIMVFSSGTTGTPKPITYTHEQVALAVEAIVEAFPDIRQGSRLACWLPLANLFQRILNFCAIEIGATSYMVSDPRALMGELRAIAPAILIGVPRFYERVHAGISSQLEALTGMRGALARWALGLARRRASRTATAWDRALVRLADKLVYSRIRAGFGSDLRYLISGSAPMANWLLQWYEALGLPVYEAYGVSEDIVPVAMNRPGARRLGTVGKPLRANDVRLADDGEILVRGPGVCRLADASAAGGGSGYWATGDLGRFDAQGFLSVVGRKADVFKLANGRWVFPQRIESALRSVPYVDHAVVLGAGRAHAVAVASVNWASLCSHALERDIDMAASREPALADAAQRLVQSEFAAAVAELAPAEQPQAVILVADGFRVESGELTTNLKLRRQAIAARFHRAIEQAYAELQSRSSRRAGPSDAPLVLLHT